METNEWLALIFIALFGCFALLSTIAFGMVSIMRKLEDIKEKL
ncbi:MAG: hypothetical protein WAZ38_13300 [Prolixibacteraceae bacterium]|jgi:hypothetical protein